MDTNKKQTIYFAWTYLSWGGAQIYFLSIMKRAAREFNIRVILPEGYSPDFLKFLDDLEVEYEFFTPATSEKRVIGPWAKLCRQYTRIRSEIGIFRALSRHGLRGNIVHIEAAPWQSWILLSALSLKRPRIFLTLHNRMGDASVIRKLIWWLRMHFVTRCLPVQIFVSNQDTRNALSHYASKRYVSRVPVTYTAIDPQQIERALMTAPGQMHLREKYSVPTDAFVVLTVGNFIDRKGRWVLLEAAKWVLQEASEVLFLWLSPEAPNGEDKTRVEKYLLGESFRIIRSADAGETRDAILQFFLIADAFALPSNVEGLPIALLEAMALGIPAISSNVNAIPEAITHRENGLLIEPMDARALSEAILELRNDPNLRHRLAKKGSDRVTRKFTEEDSAQTALKAYRGELDSMEFLSA